MSVSYGICGAAARRVFAIQSARGSPDWPSALISLSMSYSTRRIESVAPSIKRYDANLPTMICANRLAPAVLFSIGCAGLPAATHRCCGGNERNITKSLADRFWADDAPLGNCPKRASRAGSPGKLHPTSQPRNWTASRLHLGKRAYFNAYAGPGSVTGALISGELRCPAPGRIPKSA